MMETKTSILKYLSCPKLRLWGRVGQAGNTGIILGDKTTLTVSDFNAMGPEGLKDVIIILCESYIPANSPLKEAIINAGACFYAAQDAPDMTNKSTAVFREFIQKAVDDSMEMCQAFEEAGHEVGADLFYWEGDSTGPFCYFWKVNLAPFFTKIIDTTVTRGDELSFTLNAVDPDNDPITYAMGGTIPVNAALNSSTGEFVWSTGTGTVGINEILFIAGDGSLSDTMAGTITLKDPSGINVAGKGKKERFNLMCTVSDNITTRFYVPFSGHVTIEIFNTQGRCVAVPVDEYMQAGSYFAGLTDELPGKGMYYVRLSVNDNAVVRRVFIGNR